MGKLSKIVECNFVCSTLQVKEKVRGTNALCCAASVAMHYTKNSKREKYLKPNQEGNSAMIKKTKNN